MENAAAWATRATGLCAAAHPEAQPKEALDGWWHFFVRLRGEAELLDDLARAKQRLAETFDDAAQRQVIQLKVALDAYLSGEVEAFDSEAPVEGAGHRGQAP